MKIKFSKEHKKLLIKFAFKHPIASFNIILAGVYAGKIVQQYVLYDCVDIKWLKKLKTCADIAKELIGPDFDFFTVNYCINQTYALYYAMYKNEA